jgi:putative endonuclease
MKFHYNYVLRSFKNGKLYVGFTDNLRQRITKHNKGLVKATNNGRPWQLVYFEACFKKEDAINREKQLKTGFGRAYLKRRITD